MTRESSGDDLTVIRTAGTVLSVFGAISIAITFAWNALGDRPDPATLVTLSGEVVDRGLITVPTRTSIERWLALDVTREGEEVRWVFPDHGDALEALVDSIEIGKAADGRALPEAQLLRWYESPVRIVWSLSQDGREVIGFDDVDEAVQAARHQSPLAGGLTLAIGLLLLGASMLRRRSAPPEPAPDESE